MTLFLKLLALLAAQGAGIPPHPGIPAPATVAAHVGDCIAATSAAGIDPAILGARGWVRGEVRTEGGRSGLEMAMFSKAGDLTLISVVLASARGRECMVLSPVADPSGLDAIRAALDGSLAVARSFDADNETVWMTPHHHIVAAQIGNAEVQGMRIRVTSLDRP